MRSLLLIISICISLSGFSQNPWIEEQISISTDYLNNNQFQEGVEYLDSILALGNFDIASELELEYQRARLFERDWKLEESTEILLSLIERCKKNELYAIQSASHTLLALIHEKVQDLDACRTQLNLSEKLNNQHDLEHLKALFFVRKSSYFRFLNKTDSVIYCAKEGLVYASKFDDIQNINDAYLLLGSAFSKINPRQAIEYYKISSSNFLNLDDGVSAAYMLANISKIYIELNDVYKAKVYIDSSFYYLNQIDQPIQSNFYKLKAIAYRQNNDFKSALDFYETYVSTRIEEAEKSQKEKIKDLTEKYENQKNTQIIAEQKETNENQRKVLLAASILGSLLLASLVLLLVSRKKVKLRESLIQNQAEELESNLKDKEILMKEVQHRVKNNLQTMIGLLGLQRGAQHSKSTDEILLECQNRIQSMAILHERLFDTDDDYFLDAHSYFQEIFELMKSSYNLPDQKITEKIDIQEEGVNSKNAIPIGLIMVELLSNTYKHAFKDKKEGTVSLSLVGIENGKYKTELTYSDNGDCPSIEKLKNSNGLGMEIINGLVKQLKGKVELKNQNGLTIKMYF